MEGYINDEENEKKRRHTPSKGGEIEGNETLFPAVSWHILSTRLGPQSFVMTIKVSMAGGGQKDRAIRTKVIHV